MRKIPLRQAWPLFLAVTAFSLLLAQPLWAAEESPTPQDKQEESFFAMIKRKTQELFDGDDAPKAKKEVEKQAPEKSGGRKAINTFKKEMNKISDNVSESVERDKKTLKKKLDKLNNKK